MRYFLTLIFLLTISTDVYAKRQRGKRRVRCPVVVDLTTGEYSRGVTKYRCYRKERYAIQDGFVKYTTIESDPNAPTGPIPPSNLIFEDAYFTGRYTNSVHLFKKQNYRLEYSFDGRLGDSSGGIFSVVLRDSDTNEWEDLLVNIIGAQTGCKRQ